MIRKPRVAAASAVARPMPRLPPVITATLSVKPTPIFPSPRLHHQVLPSRAANRSNTDLSVRLTKQKRMKGVRNGIRHQAAKPIPLPFLRLIGIAKKKQLRILSRNGSSERRRDGSSIDPSLEIQHQAGRILQALLDAHQEGHGFLAVDDAVIIGQRQID